MPLAIFVAGVLGAAAMFALETYPDVLNWPVNIGGRPAFSWPAFVPIAFEFGVLCAITTGIVGYLAINGLPRLWEPVDEYAAMRQAMRAEWVVSVRNEDGRRVEEARRILLSLQPAIDREHVPRAGGGRGMREAVALLVAAGGAGRVRRHDPPAAAEDVLARGGAGAAAEGHRGIRQAARDGSAADAGAARARTGAVPHLTARPAIPSSATATA